MGFAGLFNTPAPAPTTTKHQVSEGYQWAVLVLVAASEEELAKEEPSNGQKLEVET